MGQTLIKYSAARDPRVDGDQLARLLSASSTSQATIVVAPYPSLSLLPLIPHVAGFIFERGSLLNHTAIALREQGCPALIVKDALSLIAEGQRVTIQPDGLFLER
jgi:phosphohistidine swiveling domain-containing protein